ncbi:MAG: Ppx/GppA family phosphatase [marine benthic group bacterium]|jgi:exopolyphosphatase/guanosine-5'-triphosphate,3'-diphosphate pyrophosphatase|nr:Ppx/GppA family phosphatase [Candidatus Benthicola marisminoris]
MQGTGSPPRLAAIDVGTNTIRLVVADVDSAASYRVLDEERAQTRLGEGLYQTGRIGAAPMDRSLSALERMRALAEGMGVQDLRAIATAAVREAENGDEFLQAAETKAGVRIQVISEDEEARLAFRSVRKHFPLTDRPAAIVDIGGGSLEVILSAGGMIEQTHSLRLGAVRLTERYARSDPLVAADWKRMRKAIDRVLEKRLGKPPFVTPVMIGSGGTFSTLATIAMFEKAGEAGPAQGYRLSRSEWQRLARRLRDAPLEVRRRIRGLNPDRADIIVAGAAAVSRLSRYLGAREILVHEGGIRDGLLLTMIDERYPEGEVLGAGDRFEWVVRFAQRCGLNEAHAAHVTHLSEQIFDALHELHQLGDDDRDLLAAAAYLHDAGYLIGHSKHHKHAYHLIMHADLPGFSAHEVEIIANVARYHRRAHPRKRHSNFARLDSADRQRVRVLSAMLRLAAGLDRTHSRAVSGVRAEVGEDRIQLELEAETEPQVEIWDAGRKTDLLEVVFGRDVTVEWAPSEASSPA